MADPILDGASSEAQSRSIDGRGLDARLAASRFYSGQVVAVKVQDLNMATELGGSKRAALLHRGDLLELGGRPPYSAGLAFYATVIAAADRNAVGRRGVAPTAFIEPASMPAAAGAVGDRGTARRGGGDLLGGGVPPPSSHAEPTAPSRSGPRAPLRSPSPALAPITPQPLAPPPPGVSPETYRATEIARATRTATRAATRAREVERAYRAGLAAGYRVAKFIGDAREGIKSLKSAMNGGWFRDRGKGPELLRGLEIEFAANLDALPLPPTYDDPELQNSMVDGFETGSKVGYGLAALEAELARVAFELLDALAGGAAAAVEAAVARTIARFGTVLARAPIIGVGAGGIGFARATPRSLVPGKSPLGQYGIDRYGTFANRPGDKLAGHEMLQNLWLEVKGFGKRLQSAASKNNPAVGLTHAEHAAVGIEQTRLGLKSRQVIAQMTAEQVIEQNAVAMRRAGIPMEVIETLKKLALEYAATLKPPP